MSETSKWLHIRVTDLKTGESKANVKIPASVANFGIKMAAKFAPESVEGLDINQILAEMKNAGESKLVDVEDDEKGQHVEIYVE
jgi:hypothetical protein